MAPKDKNKTVLPDQMSSEVGKLSMSKPKDKLNSMGSSGTVFSEGVISEEYNPNLEGLNGMDVYERMRKSDAQVSAVLLACELPLKSTKWYIDPYVGESGESDSKDKEIAEFVTEALFDNMYNTWSEMLTEVFTFLAFGFSVFEKVYYSDGEKVWLKKMGLRKQTTIKQWELSDGTPGIIQKLPQPIKYGVNEGKDEVEIPSDKLVIFSYKKEGDNYEGVSLLRPAYKHFHIKDQLYKFDAVKHERQSVGIPVIYMPSDADDEDRAEAQTIVDNVRSTEQTGVVMPGTKEEGWLFEFADMKGGSGTNLYESIKHHNREITKVILAQFIELGNTESGSRSLGESQGELFFQAIEFIGNYVRDMFNRYVIPELVDLNFDTEVYPVLKYRKIRKVDWEKISKGLKDLADSNYILPNDKTESYLRDLFDLPARESTEEETPRGTEKAKPTDTTETKEIKKEGKPEVKANEDHEHKEPPGCLDRDFMGFSELVDNKLIIQLQNEVPSLEDKARLKKKGLRFNDYEKSAFRALTFAERKVNFTSLNRSMETFSDILQKKLTDITNKQKEDLLKQVKKAVDNNDIKAIGIIKAKYKTELSNALTDVQKEMFEIGKKTAATEMAVKVPPTNVEVRGAMRVQNATLIDELINKTESVVKNGVIEMSTKRAGMENLASAEAVATISTAIDDVVSKAVQSLGTLTVIGSVNMGRASIFERYPEKIYAMQYSAILDDRTTDHCLSLDGRVVKAGSRDFYNYSPPQHYGCRSLWVEILQEEVFKPTITGIPSSIAPSKTITTAKLLKKPILLKNSPAVKVIQEEIDDRKSKLEALIVSKQFPNRQVAHQKRIKQLESSIKNKFTEGKNVLSDMFKEILKADGIQFND